MCEYKMDHEIGGEGSYKSYFKTATFYTAIEFEFELR